MIIGLPPVLILAQLSVSSPSQREMNSEYAGFHPPKSFKLEIIEIKDIENYVSTRKPCILQLPITLDVQKFMECPRVQVEINRDNAFGHGIKVAKSFREFLAGDGYLNTQYANEQSPISEFLAPPLDYCVEAVPKVWEMFPFLIPHQVNLWMGSSTGSSSGLHHDFHDNFYFLVKGKKRIVLFSPKDADKMYLTGQVRKVHCNGLIEYSDDFPVRSDGAYIHLVKQYKVDKCQEALELAESSGDVDEIARCEEALEMSLEAMLDDEDVGEDDQEDLDEDITEDGDGDGDEREPFDAAQSNDTQDTQESKKQKQGDGLPASFSRAKLNDDAYPLLKEAVSVTVELEAGQCLYLPCGALV
jgi:hypothetical protein